MAGCWGKERKLQAREVPGTARWKILAFCVPLVCLPFLQSMESTLQGLQKETHLGLCKVSPVFIETFFQRNESLLCPVCQHRTSARTIQQGSLEVSEHGME